jgi:hypothetical protein
VDGSCSTTLLDGYHMDCHLGPLPIGPCPTAVFSGVAFVASVVVWALCRRRKKGSASVPAPAPCSGKLTPCMSRPTATT